MHYFVWDVQPTILFLGPLQLRYYGILFGLTLLVGFSLFTRRMKAYGYSEEISEKFLLYGVLGVVIGARLVHCLFYEPNFYLSNPIEILKVWKGGIASHGATVGLFTVAIWFSRKNKIPFFHLGDSIVFAAAVGATFVRIGNFFNSEIVGRITNVPWGVKFLKHSADIGLAEKAAVGHCDISNINCLIQYWPVRHPSELYEATGGLIILITLLLVDKMTKGKDLTGIFSGIFLTIYFTFRFFIEFVKEYQALNGFLTMGQWLSIPFIIVGIIIFVNSIKRYKNSK